MKVGDIVREVTRMNRVPELGLVIEVDVLADAGTAKDLVLFADGEEDWMPRHHLEALSESR